MAKTQGIGSIRRRTLMGGGIGGAALLATGCSIFDSGTSGSGGGGADSGSDSGDGEGGSLVIALGTVVDSLDPHYVNNSMYILPSGLQEGLVIQNEDGTDAVPALAESWEVSEDELTYTFTMREGATWSNGDPITAEDAMWSFQRLLTPSGAGSGYTTGASSYLPSIGIRGAADFLAGAVSSWDEVGITAPDEKTLVIELESPNPDFLVNMTHYSMTLLHKASVEADAQGWSQPENWVGNGPYVLTQWEPNTIIEMEKNPEYWDADSVAVSNISVQLGSDPTASVLSFRGGELDIVKISGSALTSDPDLEASVTEVGGYSTFYLQSMWGGHEAIKDQRVRRALSMAIDREALANSPGLQPGLTLMPDSVPGWSEEIAIAYDVDGARALLQEAGHEDNLPGLRIQAGVEEPMLEILREGLIDALGIEVSIDILEAGVHADTRWQPHDDPSVMSFYYGSFAGVSTMPNWIFNIFGADHVRQFSMPHEAWVELQDAQTDESLDGAQVAAKVEEILSARSAPEAQEYARLAKDAGATLDEEERTKKFLEAAKIREELAYTIPLAWGSQMWLTSGRVSGLQGRPSPEGYYFKTLTVSE